MPIVEADVLTVDWKLFKRRVRSGLETTGYRRYAKWRNSLKRSRDETADEDGAQSSNTKRTRVESS